MQSILPGTGSAAFRDEPNALLLLSCPYRDDKSSLSPSLCPGVYQCRNLIGGSLSGFEAGSLQPFGSRLSGHLRSANWMAYILTLR